MNFRAPIARSALIGAIVSTMGLFPLLNGLSSRPVWLQWTAFDSWETLAAWMAGAVFVACTLWLPMRARRRRLADGVCAGWLFVSALMLTGALVKVESVMGYVDAYRSSATLVVGIFAALLIALACLAIARPGIAPVSRIQRLAMIGWPLIPLFVYHLWQAPALAAGQRAIYSPSPSQAATKPLAHPSRHAGLRTVVLLFDELSPDYLFGDRAVDLSAYPALDRLRKQGEIHRDAHLTGGATRYAIPALFGALPQAPQGIVRALYDQGRSVRVWGWYHDYCVGLAQAADVCRSISIYNVRTLHDGVSLLDPWWTDVNLLPADRPFDLVKVPIAVEFHRRTLNAAKTWMATQLSDPSADFIYVHVNVPHLPLLDSPDAKIREPSPFVLSEAGYLRQFGAIDSVVAEVLASQTRPTQLIVLSDHNARPLFPKAQHDHVVFIVLRPGPRAPDITSRENAASTVARLALDSAEP